MISCCATSLRFRTGANGQGRSGNCRGHVVRLLLWALLLPVWAPAQTIYPVQSSLQLLPPYSVYLSDYAQPGAEKLRVILLQRDLSQVAYSLRLVFSVELNGRVILRTARAFNPPPLALDPGVPTVISGADLAPYLDSRNLEFVGYSKEQYERTRALPEGSYRLCVSAYDYRRQDVPVAAEACAFYFLAKSEPPLINYPACGTKLPARPVQQVVFSWLPRNTASANSAATTEYEFSFYEVRPAGRNVNDVVLSSRPIYQVSTDYTQLVYGMNEPALQESMQYVWRVQARDKDGKDLFRNNGYSEVCSFTYGGVDPAFVVGGVKAFKAQAQAERKATLSWQVDQKGFEGYRVEYKKTGVGYEWFKTDTKEGELKVFDLEPDTEYEARVQGQVKGVYGPYSEVVTFRTPKERVVACGENVPVPQLQQGKPLAFATPGMSIQARGMEVILEEVEHLPEDGFYKGTGRVSINYLGGAAFAVKFERIYIDEDRNVVSGRIDVLSQGVEAMSQGQLANQRTRQQLRSLSGELAGLDTASAATLLTWAQTLGGLQAGVIDETLVLTAQEKEQFKVLQNTIGQQAQALSADPVNPTLVTALRQELAQVKPLVQKLGDGVGKGVLVRLGIDDLLKKIQGVKGILQQDKQLDVAAYKEILLSLDEILASSQLNTLSKSQLVDAQKKLKQEQDLLGLLASTAQLIQVPDEKQRQLISEQLTLVENLLQSSAQADIRVYQVQKLLDFIKANKGKTAVNYHSTHYFKDVKDESNTKVYLPVQVGGGKTIQVYVDFVKGEGSLNLAANEQQFFEGIGLRIDLSNQYHTGFFVNFRSQTDKSRLFELWVSDYGSYESLLQYLGFAITEGTKAFFVNQYKNSIAQAGQDCDKLDVIFETVPPFVTQALDDATLWGYLNSLLNCSMVADVGTNEDKAVLTLLNSIKNRKWLYEQLVSKEEVAVELFDQLEGDWLLGYLELCRQLSNQYSRGAAVAEQFIYIGSAGSAYRDNASLYQKPYLLTDASGYNATEKKMVFDCIIGRPNISLVNWGTAEKHAQISGFRCGLFAPVKVYFNEPDNVEQLPALYAYYLGAQRNRAELLGAINKGVTVFGVASGIRILFTKGAGYVAKTVAVTELVKVSLDAALALESVQASLNRTEGGRWFIKHWPILSLATDLATIGTDVLVSLSKNKAVIRQALAENGQAEAVKSFDELVQEAETVAQARGGTQARQQPVDEFVEEWADGSRNAPGSGKPVEKVVPDEDIVKLLPKEVQERISKLSFDKKTTLLKRIIFDKELENLIKDTPELVDVWQVIDNDISLIKKVKVLPYEHSDYLASTFKDGRFVTVELKEPTKFYRAYGGKATPTGSFVSTEAVTDKVIGRNRLALLDEWGNTLTAQIEILVPKGTKLQIGVVGKQVSKDGKQILSGGADQIVLPRDWGNLQDFTYTEIGF